MRVFEVTFNTCEGVQAEVVFCTQVKEGEGALYFLHEGLVVASYMLDKLIKYKRLTSGVGPRSEPLHFDLWEAEEGDMYFVNHRFVGIKPSVPVDPKDILSYIEGRIGFGQWPSDRVAYLIDRDLGYNKLVDYLGQLENFHYKRGMKPARIKELREKVQDGVVRLKQAAAAGRGKGNPITPPKLAPQFDEKMHKELLAIYGKDKKIPAIKHYRQKTGSGLRESKEAIEQWMEYHGL